MPRRKSPPAGDIPPPGDDGLPPRVIDGHVNIEYFRQQLARAQSASLTAIEAGGAIPFNLEAFTKAVHREASLYGLSEQDIHDKRTDAQVIRDAVEALLDEPEELWAQTTATLERLEEEVEKTVKYVSEELEKRRPDKGERMDQANRDREARLERGKRLAGLLKRVRRLQELATTKHPSRVSVELFPVYEACRPLFFMLCVGRTNADTLAIERNGHVTRVFRIGRHHARFALTYWMARNGIRFEGYKIMRDEPWTGCALISHPGTGKSEFAMHVIAQEACMRPTMQAAYLHAVSEQAEGALAYIQNLFRLDNDSGRRCMALYPGLALDGKDNNATKMRLKLPQRLKSPTIVAAGTGAKALGSNTDFQVRDDVVPLSDAHQPAERERRKQTLAGTWDSRQRGKGFTFIIGTVWHPNDYLGEIMADALAGRGSILLDRQYCGGPTTNPAFFPLWPEVYDAAELRRRYEKLRDPALWSAAYEANPISDAARVIKKLRYYDPNTKEHADFMASAQLHVSVDPSATNRETSDPVGLLYLGLGEVVTPINENTRRNSQRVRFLDAYQQRISQVDLAEHIGHYLLHHITAQVHMETRMIGHATCDIIENRYGVVVNRLDTTNMKKLVRLKQCAGVIDDSMPGLRAIVEFPGAPTGKMHEDGTPEIGPDTSKWGWFYDQYLNFGFAEDHLVDAGTQILRYFLENNYISGGEGEATMAVVKSLKQTGDPRILAMLKEAEQARQPKNQWQEDDEWMRRRTGW